jgi:hypothetical protein
LLFNRAKTNWHLCVLKLQKSLGELFGTKWLVREPGDLTVIQFDFVPRVEGVAWHACDTIIAGVVNDTEAALGPGEDAGNPADTRLPAPPWWLLGVTAFGLLALFGDIMKAVFGP